LKMADLRGADLRGAALPEANLYRVDLGKADLRGVILFKADLEEAYLSGAVIDEYTFYQWAKGCTKGVNGFYVEWTDSAALMTLTPPGDSMKGTDASAVVESLKQARSLHVFSMTLAALVFYIAVQKPEQIKLPLIDVMMPTGKFGLFAMSF